MTHHRLHLNDRGPQHRHRWQATCVCGWSAIPLRVKRSAVRTYRHHTRSRAPDRPAVPTATGDLPLELRP